MKAEHRKELHTNALADRLGSVVQAFKSGGRSTSWYVWGLLLLVVAGFIAWRWIASASFDKRSLLWTQFDGAVSSGDHKELEDLARNQSGTVPGQMVRFQLARLQLHEGLDSLGSESRRAEGADQVEQARDAYLQLAREDSEEPLLTQEALMNAAKAEEALIGIPRKDNPGEARGSLDRAIQLYRQLAGAQPASFQTKAAGERADFLEKNASTIQKFYAELNQRVSGPPR